MNQSSISIVIPCYRSENTIAAVVNRLMETMKSRGCDNYEIILVSDSSPDNVFGVIEKLSAADKRIKGIELSRNFGQHSALMAGYRHSSGDVIVSMDDDGQTSPESIFLLIDKLAEGYDVVYAAYPRIRQNVFRRLGSAVNKYMMEKFLKKQKDLVVSSFYACRRFILDEVMRYEAPYPYLTGLVFRATRNVANVSVEHHTRMDGKSGYTLTKLISLWLNGFTAFSVIPLRAASILGVVCAFVSFIFICYGVIIKIINPAVPQGYTALVSIVLFVGGLIMIMLGVMGEYLGRIYISINNAPQYVIKRTINMPEGDDNNAKKC